MHDTNKNTQDPNFVPFQKTLEAIAAEEKAKLQQSLGFLTCAAIAHIEKIFSESNKKFTN